MLLHLLGYVLRSIEQPCKNSLYHSFLSLFKRPHHILQVDSVLTNRFIYSLGQTLNKKSTPALPSTSKYLDMHSTGISHKVFVLVAFLLLLWDTMTKPTYKRKCLIGFRVRRLESHDSRAKVWRQEQLAKRSHLIPQAGGRDHHSFETSDLPNDTLP